MLLRIYLTLMFSHTLLFSQEIIAHRGASYDAPENTISSFQLAWKEGADCIEADFYLTKDKKVVCFHDRTLKKTAGLNKKIENCTWKELKDLDVGKWKNVKYKGERIPLLSDVLNTVPPGKGIFIELKSGPEIVPYVQEILEKSSITKEQVQFICFNKKCISECKRLMPEIKAQWLFAFRKDKKTGKYIPSTKEILDTLKSIKADGAGAGLRPAMLTVDFAGQLKKAGFFLNVWTVTKRDDALNLQKIGADFITTDRPQFIREALKNKLAK